MAEGDCSETKEYLQPVQNTLYDALNALAVQLGGFSDWGQILEHTGSEIHRMGLECAIAFSDPREDALTVRYVSLEAPDLAAAEASAGLRLVGRQVPLDLDLLTPLWRGRPLFVSDIFRLTTALFPDISQDALLSAAQAHRDVRALRAVCLPMQIGDQRVGAMALWGPEMSTVDVPVLSLFASQVAYAIQSARNRALLQDVIDAQGEGIGIVDRDECFVLVNPAAETIFGASPGELVGRCVMDFVDSDNQALIQEETEKRRQGQESTYELEISRPDGVRRRLLVTAVPRIDREGDYVGAYGVFRDDTERSDREAALLGAYGELEVRVAQRTAELHDANRRLQEHVRNLKQEVSRHARTEMYLQERNQELALFGRSIYALTAALDTEHVLESIIDQAHRLLGVVACSVWLLDPQAKELVCQQAAGYGDREVLGWRLPIEEGIVGAAVRTGRTVNVPDTRHDERHYKEIDGQTGVETRSVLAVPLQAQGKLIGVLEVVDDAPNRFSSADATLVELMALSAANALENARVHEALQSSRRVLERRNQDLLVLNAVAAIVGQSLSLEQTLTEGLDKVLEMSRVDAGWIGLFGPQRASLSLAISRGLGTDTLDKLEKAGVHNDTCKAAILAGEPVVMPLSLVGSDLGHENAHQTIAATLVAVAIRARESLLGVLGGLFYGTPDLDDQDVQLLITIGHQLGAAVEQKRLLREASEIEVLRELDTMRSELIATASHELRTPLGLIRLFATALLMEEVALDVETSQQFLSGIADETEKLEHILDDLLDLGRMESGRLLLDRKPVDLVQLTEDTLDRMSIELEERRKKVDFDEGSLIAVVDPARIEQVLRNLLSNAVKYSAPGSEITVRTWHAGESIALSVIDKGIGIPEEEQERIFERFYRVDNDLTRRTRGAGLGLSICKWIVEAHGGSIQVFSEPGSGSEFRIMLPVEVGI